MDVVGHAEFGRGCACLVLLAAPPIASSPGYCVELPSVTQTIAHLVAALDRVKRDRAAHPEHLVVRVRREHEDPFIRAPLPTSSAPLVSISSSRSAPSPQATTGPSARCSTIVPAAAARSSTTGRARQITTLASPIHVNAPGYGLVCARTQSWRYGARVSQSMIPSSGVRFGQALARRAILWAALFRSGDDPRHARADELEVCVGEGSVERRRGLVRCDRHRRPGRRSDRSRRSDR